MSTIFSNFQSVVSQSSAVQLKQIVLSVEISKTEMETFANQIIESGIAISLLNSGILQINKISGGSKAYDAIYGIRTIFL